MEEKSEYFIVSRRAFSSSDNCVLGRGCKGAEAALLDHCVTWGAPAWWIAQSRAFALNRSGFVINIVATSASWGSFGSGVQRRDWRERRTDLMVKTGDQAVLKVSRQIAPYFSKSTFPSLVLKLITYSLTADIWMPELSCELHYWWTERIFIWDFDVDNISTSFIGCVWWTHKGSLKVG